MRKHYPLLFVLLSAQLFFCTATAQVNGGNHAYEFLNLPASARISALGGQLLTTADDDVSLAFANPAVANAAQHQAIAFSHQFLPAGINTGYAAFGWHADSLATTFHGGFRYISYGEFDLTDETDQVMGTFKASELALTVGAARQLYDKLSLGMNMRFISSRFESYQSYGLTFDFGALYRDTASLLSMAVVLRNAGRQLTPYFETRQPVPFEMLVGLSKRLRYTPLRLSVTYRYLDRWNVRYDDPNAEEDLFFFGDANASSNKSHFLDNLARHFVFGAEFLFGKKDNFRVRFGYDHRQRKELTVNNLRTLSGFSFGVGIKINRFRLDFSRSANHIDAGITHLTLSTNIQAFTRPHANLFDQD